MGNDYLLVSVYVKTYIKTASQILLELIGGFVYIIDQKSLEKRLCKEEGKEHVPNELENGDTPKQLLARSRYLLFKQENKWTPTQRHRAEVLFHHYPDLKTAYNVCQELMGIYQNTKDKALAYTKLARWYDKVKNADFKTFSTVSRSIYTSLRTGVQMLLWNLSMQR